MPIALAPGITLRADGNYIKSFSIADHADGEAPDSSLSQLEHNCNFNFSRKPAFLRKTGIICTLGPATRTIPILHCMFDAGMNIARLNFSHGTHEYHLDTVNLVREAEKSYTPYFRPICIALDTKGPEIRTGLIHGSATGELELVAGDKIRVTHNKTFEEKCDNEVIYVDYENICKVLCEGSKIYIDDGLICLTVEEIGCDFLNCIIDNGGLLGSRKGVNLPGAPVDLPAMSEKDKQDLQFAVDHRLDLIFASFIRNGRSIKSMREFLGEKGAYIKIIAKIENQQGIENIDEIIQEADGIMVARGDMGIEIPSEKVFLVQKMILARCNVVGKPCICATQMLESMTLKPRPTRAETGDVANAVLDGADCVMLSGETAKGIFPIECVKMMSDICKEAENLISHPLLLQDLKRVLRKPADATVATAVAAVEASIRCMSKAIVVITTSGRTAECISHFRPRCPILTVTRDAVTSRQLHIYRGCHPIFYGERKCDLWADDVNRRTACALEYGRKIELLHDGDNVLVVAGWKPESGSTNSVRIIELGSLSEHNIIGVPDIKMYKN